MVGRYAWRLALSVLGAVSPAQGGEPAGDSPCLMDARVGPWLSSVQGLVQPWRRDPLRGVYERVRPGDPGAVKVVRDPRICRRAVEALRAAWKSAGFPRPQAGYVLRLPDGGHVVILPGDTAGERPVSHGFDRDWKRAQVSVGL